MFRRACCLIVVLAAGGCLQDHEIFRDVEHERRAVGEACSRDEDCVVPSVCQNGTCAACPSTMRCRPDFNSLQRNGCSWCTPHNECTSNSECGSEMKCFAGMQCPPGCYDDPSCCFGNLCGDPSGGPPPNFDCSRVGCADGSECVMYDGQNECDYMFGGMPPGGGRM